MKHFIKKIEDFKCLNCGYENEGNGYTNHCQKCLYSLHVDENTPGDRKSNCKGLMRPIGVDKKGERYILIHRCVKCGKEIRNGVNKDDDFDEVVRVSGLH